jgi:predicted hotdog family 3-hydroxylacyl-ACP dehydratase
MTAARLPSPADLVSHRGDVLLLDEVTHAGEDRFEARLVVRPGTAFSDASGDLPAWVGAEIMAQAIAALSGHRSLSRSGRPAPAGLLLGIRSYRAAAGVFRCGHSLQVEVAESSEDDAGWAVFDGRILCDGVVVAAGTLTVFQPPDDEFLETECARDD